MHGSVCEPAASETARSSGSNRTGAWRAQSKLSMIFQLFIDRRRLRTTTGDLDPPRQVDDRSGPLSQLQGRRESLGLCGDRRLHRHCARRLLSVSPRPAIPLQPAGAQRQRPRFWARCAAIASRRSPGIEPKLSTQRRWRAPAPGVGGGWGARLLPGLAGGGWRPGDQHTCRNSCLGASHAQLPRSPRP